jgi:hypothetical protein
MKGSIKALFFHFFAIAFFIVAALAYFHPVLQGKVIQQSDIIQYTGMAKEQNDYREKTREEPYWTNGAFGGMPTYQLGANYPHNYIKQLDKVLRFLPRPADYLFLYFIGFYILLCCMKVDHRLAILGAIAFGFSTYLVIILGVGHNAKAHAIAYLPMILGGILLTFRKKYVWGFILTALAMALEINANHYQMTYYFMLLVLILGAVVLFDAIKKKKLKHFLGSVGLLVLAVVLGVAVNATALLATKEYADWSTRGKTSLTINPDGSPKQQLEGLDKDYITQYSYGIAESLNLFVPRLFGGSNSEDLGQDSKAYEFLTDQGLTRTKALDFSRSLPLYWGAQPIVAAPAYVGAVIFFLCILGLFIVKGKTKWWLLGGIVLSLILSWGKNFGIVTDFMIDYFPMYNKFRAVSSIQIVLELCMPILAMLALSTLFKEKTTPSSKVKALKTSFFIVLGLGVVIFLMKGFFDFTGLNDGTYQRYFGDELMAMIQRDREAVYINDTIRSLVYVFLAAIALWFFLKGKLKKNILILTLGVLICFDLIGVNLRYVNEEDFVSKRVMNEPFQETPVDKQIKQDTAVYRVYDTSEGLNGARTSYFHKSIGGYHAAKPAIIQDLFDYHIYKNNRQVLNMLNVKYIIQQDEEGRSFASINPEANGNAWFIKSLKPVRSANEEIMALDSLNTSYEAVVNTNEFPLINRFRFQQDSTLAVNLKTYEPNQLVYESVNNNDGVLVFSELYYPQGWQSYIDGEPVKHFSVNYGLRALLVPEGNHTVVFRFNPKVIQQGSVISLTSSILLLVIVLGGSVFSFWVASKKKEKE